MKRKIAIAVCCLAFTLLFGVGSAFAAATPQKITVHIYGNTLAVDYDGEPHTVSGYTWALDPDNATFSYSDADIVYNGVASVTETNVRRATVADPVASYSMGLDVDMFENVNGAFDVTFVIEEDGYLTINPIDTTVTVTESSAVENFTGSPYTISGYASKEPSSSLYNVAKLIDMQTEKWTVTGTNAGTYSLGLDAGDFENTDPNFDTVTVKIVDGALVICPKLVIHYWKNAVGGEQAAADAEYWVVGGETQSFASPSVKGWAADKESVSWTAPAGNLSAEDSVVEIDLIYTGADEPETSPDVIPKTGDSAPLQAVLALCIVSGAVLALALRNKLEYAKEKHA